MSDNRTSVQIDGLSKQEILQAAHDEMARYEKDLRAEARKEQKTFNLSTTLLLLLLFVLACGLIVSFAWHKPASVPTPDAQQQAN